MNSLDKIHQDYQVCFNADGSVKACGRDACRRLISELSGVYSGIDFGNPDTGYMNIKNINKYMMNTYVKCQLPTPKS